MELRQLVCCAVLCRAVPCRAVPCLAVFKQSGHTTEVSHGRDDKPLLRVHAIMQ